MTRLKLLFPLLALAALAPVSVWAQEDDDDDGPDTRTVVAIDERYFTNKTDQKNANFSTLVDRLKTELVNVGVFRVMDRNDLEQFLGEQATNEALAGGSGEGGMAANSWCVNIAVLQYGIATSTRVNPVTYAQSVSEIAKIELNLTVLSVDSANRAGETIKAKRVVKEVAARSSVAANIREQALQEVMQLAMAEVVQELVMLNTYEILGLDDNGFAIVDLPGSAIKPGAYLEVVEVGKKIRSKRTGKKTNITTTIGSLVVESVDEDYCTARPVALTPGKQIREGQKVKIVPPPTAAQPAVAAPAYRSAGDTSPF